MSDDIEISPIEDILGSHTCSALDAATATIRIPSAEPTEDMVHSWTVVILETKQGWLLMHRAAQRDGMVLGLLIEYCPFCGMELILSFK